MVDRQKHKYVEKVRTKSGKIRYVYDKSAKDKMVSLSGNQLLDSIGDYAHDEFFNRYTEDDKTKYKRQQQQQKRILDNGKRFVDSLLIPVK